MRWLFSVTPVRPPRKRPSSRPQVEALEDRCVPATFNPAVYPIQENNLTAQWTEDLMLGAARGSPQVVFLGDSITQWFATGAGAAAWDASVAPLGVDNFAVPGATTSDVLWQLDNGQLSGTSASVIVLMIGVNNLENGQTPEQTAEGIAAVVQTLETIQPQAHILLESLLPAGADPFSTIRQEVLQTDALISGLSSWRNVSYLDVGHVFMLPGGAINPALTWDYVHPDGLGYVYLADALLPTLDALVKNGRVSGASSSAFAQQSTGTAGISASLNATALFNSPAL